MIQKIKSFILASSAGIMLAVSSLALPLIGLSTVNAACNNISQGITQGANQATGETANCDDDTNANASGIAKIGRGLVNLISVIVGVVAILAIIIGGFRYITSGGDSNRVSGAKNTLIYAIIGLIIVALAQIIVRFVLNETNDALSAT